MPKCANGASAEDSSEYEGIVVLGVPRSGTTLLRRLVNAHPEITCPPETNLLGACSRFLHEEEFGDGLAVGVLSGLAFSGFEEDEVLDRLRELCFGFLREIADRDGKRLWAEKTAFDSFHIDAIERLCGDRVRYLCIHRHGLDVVCSLAELSQKMERYVTDLHEYVRRHPRPHEAFARAWLDVSRRMLDLEAHRPEQCVAVRYEDLVGDPAAELTRIFDRLGLPTDVAMLLDRAFADPGTPGLGDWKTYQRSALDPQSIGRFETLTPNTRNRLAPLLNPTLQELGYEPVAEGRVTTAAGARRRLQLSLMAARLKAGVSSERRGGGA